MYKRQGQNALSKPLCALRGTGCGVLNFFDHSLPLLCVLPLHRRRILLPHPGKQTVLCAQCVLCAGFCDLPIPHHIDAVGVGDGGQAVRNHQHRFALGKLGKSRLHLSFIVRVSKSGGLVQDQDCLLYTSRCV